MVTDLALVLKTALAQADEIWVASAMVNDSGFSLFESYLPKSCKVNLLIGIDLPTTVSVLKTIKGKIAPGIFDAQIYKDANATFHPKVYLMRTAHSYCAFVGSSNLTNGGLTNNIEQNCRIDDQTHCREILAWFGSLYTRGFPLNDGNIAEYERSYTTLTEANDAIKKANTAVVLKKGTEKIDFEQIDFTDRYFKKEHFLAFKRELWRDKSPEANKRRRKAKGRFLQLHETIFDRFREFGLSDLHTNVKKNIVSLDYHPENRPNQDLNAMWLSYGKSREDIKWYHNLFPQVPGDDEDDLQSFINHARLQVRIEMAEIGIWILFGKNNGGSSFDRKYFRDRMKDSVYRQLFFDRLRNLSGMFWIMVNSTRRFVNTFGDREELHTFCKDDTDRSYFIIGRDFEITDVEMSEENLPETVLTEFSRLYPLYEMMRHRPV